FQAEDGIRDATVTGVQTCALPIFDVNGRGTLLTTEECLLDPNVQTRNPGLSRYEIENVFRETLGVTNTLWLGKGIAGDDTHGHEIGRASCRKSVEGEVGSGRWTRE